MEKKSFVIIFILFLYSVNVGRFWLFLFFYYFFLSIFIERYENSLNCPFKIKIDGTILSIYFCDIFIEWETKQKTKKKSTPSILIKIYQGTKSFYYWINCQCHNRFPFHLLWNNTKNKNKKRSFCRSQFQFCPGVTFFFWCSFQLLFILPPTFSFVQKRIFFLFPSLYSFHFLFSSCLSENSKCQKIRAILVFIVSLWQEENRNFFWLVLQFRGWRVIKKK